MENQHRKIKGYRELTQYEIDKMNAVKELAVKVGDLISELVGDGRFDQRWVSIGKTDLQTGFIAVVRSIAKPDSF